jgi:hypothetical protein
LERYSQAGTILILSGSRQVAVAKIDQLFNKNNHQIDMIPLNGLLWLRVFGAFSQSVQFGADTLNLNKTEHESPKTTEQKLWEFLNKLRAPA